VPSAGVTGRGRERLALLARTDDGFAIAEADLEMRGPGELWGTRQSGLPRLKLADFARDAALLERAVTAARAIVSEDERLALPRHAALRAALLADYREPLALALVG